MQKETIKLELSAKPLQIKMSERRDFKISIIATNQGDKIIDPQISRAKLFVNDKRSIVWSLAISNGKREAKWFALPPDETVSMTWSAMGESLFPKPGIFTLVLNFNEIKLNPIKIQVNEK